MEWDRIGRLWSYPRRNASPRRRWEYIGRSRGDAFRMMDGSTCEEELTGRGGKMAAALAATLGIDKTTRVLEVGCGVARLGRELAPLCRSYTGVDISGTLLRHARRRTAHLANVQFSRVEGEGLPGLPDASFDRVICHLVFLHLDESDIRALLRGFRRVLTADGVAYFDAWNLRHPEVWNLFQREMADERVRRQPHRARFYFREAVEEWLDASALRPVWIADRDSLLQVVAARSDAESAVVGDRARLLDSAGQRLAPPPGPGLPPPPRH
jgi:ubiquinone/menaquinone biosynthesis C-methylase UbiE